MNQPANRPARRLRDSWLVRIGLLLLIIGSGPLLCVIAAAELGLTSDPNPNPIGFGMLFGVSFVPSLALILAGALTVIFENRYRSGG